MRQAADGGSKEFCVCGHDYSFSFSFSFFIWWGNRIRFPLAPGFRRDAPAIRGHTLSSKGARLSRSLNARESSHLRNASLPVCRFAAINKKIFLSANCCSRVRPAEV
jgi:hypothetical protein